MNLKLLYFIPACNVKPYALGYVSWSEQVVESSLQKLDFILINVSSSLKHVKNKL